MSSPARWPALLLAAALAWPAGAAEFATFDLAALMEMLASVASAKDDFTETRHSALLNAPLVLKGSLVYERPDRLEKNVVAPYQERTVISGNSVTIENRALKQTRTFSLTSSAAVSALVESMRATLAGDRASLERHYSVQLDGRADAWTLSLAPREPKLAAMIKRIQISGVRERVKRIDIDEASGDRSVMLIGAEQP